MITLHTVDKWEYVPKPNEESNVTELIAYHTRHCVHAEYDRIKKMWVHDYDFKIDEVTLRC